MVTLSNSIVELQKKLDIEQQRQEALDKKALSGFGKNLGSLANINNFA